MNFLLPFLKFVIFSHTFIAEENITNCRDVPGSCLFKRKCVNLLG